MISASSSLGGRLSSFSKNKFKLGLFGMNLSSGRSATKVPERWSGNWDDNVIAAQMADAAGMDFHLPVARWKGFGGATNFEGAGFETTLWAGGLLAQTKRITIFATVHAPLVHPILAAKQFVSADHMGRGRFALNVVCGWNGDEFDMFGIEQREHDDRYEFGSEWISIIYRLWEEEGKFDFDGDYFHLKNVEAEPKPYGGTRPIVMNAGSSAAGQAFAIGNAEMLFRAWRGTEYNKADNAQTRSGASAIGREVQVYTQGYVICRPTLKEALEFEHYVVEQGDWEAVDHLLEVMLPNNHLLNGMTPEQVAEIRRRFAAGHGGCPIVGDPDTVAAALADVSAAGFDGFAFSHVNYNQEFPFFRDEVLPRLERMGLREPA